MEIFGFSVAKIVTILIIAIIIFGPDKVPEMARTVGRTIRDVRRYMNAMTAEFNDATGGLREEFAGIAQDLKGELAATQADLRSQLDLTGVFDNAVSRGDPASVPVVTPVDVVVVPPAVIDRSDVQPAAIGISGRNGIAAPETAMPADNGGKGSASYPTKADPFADFATVAPTEPGSRNLPHRGRSVGTSPAREFAAPSGTARLVIGRSVAASAYLRRKSGAVPPCRRLCRCAPPTFRDDNHSFTASHEATSALIAAP